MRLRALDQIHVSAVKADVIRPREEFEIGDAAGAELLKSHPGVFARVDEVAGKAESKPANKAEPGAPSNKTVTGRKAK